MSGAGNRMLDFGLLALTTESDRVFLCAADPVDYAAANATHVGVKNGSRGSMFLAISSPLQGGRLASMAGFLDGDITSNGTANFVVVADSINQNILITEVLAQPQVVKIGGKFSIATLDVALGRSSQPQPVSLTVSSPVIGVPAFTKVQPVSINLIVASPVLGAPILVATQSGWINIPIHTVVGLFTCEYDATPSALGLDNATGLSAAPAADFPDVACIVRFSSQSNPNTIDCRNGGAYAADAVMNYSAGVIYHVRIVGNIPSHTYSVFVKPAALAEVQLANNYAFRTEQNAVTQLSNFARNATDVGTVAISNITFNSLSASPLTVSSPVLDQVAVNGKVVLLASNMAVQSPVFGGVLNVKRNFLVPTMQISSPTFVAPSLVQNSGGQPAGAFTAQTGDFTISWDASPTQSVEDAICGLSNGAPAAATSMACIVRFNNTGNLDCRNGATYAASVTVPYSAGMSFHLRLVVRISSHTYDVFATPQGQSEILLANNFAFRAEQATITTLSYLGKILLVGDALLTNMTNPAPLTLPPVVNDQTLTLATSGTGWVAGDLVGTMTASYSPTAWAITAGNTSGFYAIASNGNITVTSAGITGLNNGTGTSTLTVRATNAFGNGTGTATVNYAPGSVSGFDIPLSFNDPMFTNMTNGGGGQMATNQVASHESVTIQDQGVYIFNQSGTARVSYCRITTDQVSNDCPFLTQRANNTSFIDHCYVFNNAPTNPTGTHVDGLQFQQFLGQPAPGVMDVANTMFVTGGLDVTAGIFCADGWAGRINLTNVILQQFAQPALRIHSDTAGPVNLYLNNVFFDIRGGSRGFLLNFGGQNVVIQQWNNVRDCTVNNGVLTLGALVPQPVPSTGGTNF